MRCEACGLDNDPSLDYCDNCEHPLGDSTTAVISAPVRSSVPRPRPAPVPEVYARPGRYGTVDDGTVDDGTVDDDADETRVVVPPGFHDQLAPPRSLTRPLLAGAAVLALIGAVGGTFLALNREDDPEPGPVVTTTATSTYTEPVTTPPTTDPTPSPSTPDPTADLASQGAALDQLLDRSKHSRDKLTKANGAVFGCDDLAGAIRRLQDVGTERDGERATLSGLDLSAMPDGEAIRSSLDSAFSHSLSADGHYVKWAQERQRNGCRKTATAEAYRIAGDGESDSAGSAKLEFLALWNPVAQNLGLPVRDRQGI